MSWEHYQTGKRAATSWAEAPENSSLAVQLKEWPPELGPGSYQLGTSRFLLLSGYLEITLKPWQKVRLGIKSNSKVRI